MKVIVRKIMNEFTPYAVILANKELEISLQHFQHDNLAYNYAAEVANVLGVEFLTLEKQIINCVEISNEEFFNGK
jgi:hypothetical protein